MKRQSGKRPVQSPKSSQSHSRTQTSSGEFTAQYMTSFWHVRARPHKHAGKTQEAVLSPNVINAAKRLTSGYLFKSRHQTHSFFSFYLLRSQKLLSGEKGRFSERRRGQRTRPELGPAASRSPSFIIYRRSVPRRRCAPPRTRPLTVRSTMDSGGSAAAVD